MAAANVINASGIIATTTQPSRFSGADIKEKATLQTFYIPESVVDWYQAERIGLGYSAPSGGALIVFLLLFVVIFIVVFSTIYSMIRNGVSKVTSMPIVRYILLGLFLAVISYVIYFYSYRKQDDKMLLQSARDDIKSLFPNVGSTEGFQNANRTPDAAADQPLLNLQPLAVKQAAYIGPNPSGGLFDPESGIQAALKAGVRFFTLQIDTLKTKKDPKKFPGTAGDPILLYRGDGPELLSANGASIKEVAQQLANYAFSEEVLNSKMPLVLYLHFLSTPNAVKSPEAYLIFLSKVAAALEPLFDRHLGPSAEGNFTRQAAEGALLRNPISAIGPKVVIFSNVDTTLFRKPELLGLKPYESRYDLDYLVHGRVFAQTGDDTLGATLVSTGAAAAKPGATLRLVRLSRIMKMSKKEQDAFAAAARGQFVIAMPSQSGNPSLPDLKNAINSLGLNVVPLNLFGESVADLRAKLALWSSNRFLQVKPVALQDMGGTAVGVSATGVV